MHDKKTIFSGYQGCRPDVLQQKDWETRENAFAAFTMGPLTDFWRQREEAEFTGVDNVPVRFVRFCAKSHDRVVVICPVALKATLSTPNGLRSFPQRF